MESDLIDRNAMDAPLGFGDDRKNTCGHRLDAVLVRRGGDYFLNVAIVAMGFHSPLVGMGSGVMILMIMVVVAMVMMMACPAAVRGQCHRGAGSGNALLFGIRKGQRELFVEPQPRKFAL